MSSDYYLRSDIIYSFQVSDEMLIFPKIHRDGSRAFPFRTLDTGGTSCKDCIHNHRSMGNPYRMGTQDIDVFDGF